LKDWQTLIGSVLGGVIALLAALIVAFRVERREDLSAAMLIVSTLVPVRIAARLLKDLADEKSFTNPDDRAAFIAEKLVWQRPKLIPSLEPAIARIMPINVMIAAHLTFFLSQYADMEKKLEPFGKAIKQHQSGIKPDRGREYLMKDAHSATRIFFQAAKHASCAEHLLNKFVLSRTPTLNKILSKVCPDANIKKCRMILQNNDS
jgi:hypothetical protein